MIVDKNRIFNLMDTNGRRRDVLNALKIYLEILEELKEFYSTEIWGAYPDSLSQFVFYEKALEKSKEVFKKHSKYDKFMSDLGENYQSFIDRDNKWIENNLPKFAGVLDEGIEQRARHYTSNLVKMGFTDANRNITEAGYAYLRGSVLRDELEEILPLDNVNIALLRQLAKLKIFTTLNDGKRQYYSPFSMALVLLLCSDRIDTHTFEIIVQGLTPYSSEKIKEAVRNNSISMVELETAVKGDIDISLPAELVGKDNIEYEVFQDIFKGSKRNSAVSKVYYGFFLALKNFRENKTKKTYAELIKCFDEENVVSLNKAFGYGKSIFSIGNRGSRYTHKARQIQSESLDKAVEQLLSAAVALGVDHLQAAVFPVALHDDPVGEAHPDVRRDHRALSPGLGRAEAISAECPCNRIEDRR